MIQISKSGSARNTLASEPALPVSIQGRNTNLSEPSQRQAAYNLALDMALKEHRQELADSRYLAMIYNDRRTGVSQTIGIVDVSGLAFKAVPSDQNFKYSTAHLERYGTQLTVGEEFLNLAELYQAAPHNVSEPICLLTHVRTGEPIGYLAEFVKGPTLAQEIKDKTISVEELQEAKSTLEAVHRQGIAHGDVRLENMIHDKNAVKMIDPIGLNSHMPADMVNKAIAEDTFAINALLRMVSLGTFSKELYNGYMNLMYERMIKDITIEAQLLGLEKREPDSLSIMDNPFINPDEIRMLKGMLREMLDEKREDSGL